MGVANARAYKAALDVALTLQHSLLPERLPDVSGLELAARYQPATNESLVRGDWYDVALTGEGVALTIGDVAGHGVRAAATMGHLGTAGHAYALSGSQPASTIELLHDLFHEMRLDGMATLCHLVLESCDVSDRTRVRFANAGHPLPLVRSSDGTTRYLSASSGAPLGAPGPQHVAESHIDLEAGSILLLYTDGLIERRGETLDTGFAQLEGAVQAGPAGVDALSDHIMATQLPTGGGDDAALLAVRIVGPVVPSRARSTERREPR